MYSKDTNFTFTISGQRIDFTAPKIMGILNLTTDSFSDGGKYNTLEKCLPWVEKMVQDGADIIDLGGYSTKPNAASISETLETQRVIPVLQQLKLNFPQTVFSIDTFRSQVAKKAIDLGADMINDVSGGLFDPQMIPLISSTNIPYVCMVGPGANHNLHPTPAPDNSIMAAAIKADISKKLQTLTASGVTKIILDPGFGFGKSIAQNHYLLAHINQLHTYQRPLLVGISRKSMIYKVLNVDPTETSTGTAALNTIALLNGANILRVHDVKAAAECIKLITFYKKSQATSTC